MALMLIFSILTIYSDFLLMNFFKETVAHIFYSKLASLEQLTKITENYNVAILLKK